MENGWVDWPRVDLGDQLGSSEVDWGEMLIEGENVAERESKTA